jgi:epsilon-lactone hydrolase
LIDFCENARYLLGLISQAHAAPAKQKSDREASMKKRQTPAQTAPNRRSLVGFLVAGTATGLASSATQAEPIEPQDGAATEDGAVQLRARTIPVPKSISPQAQTYLKQGARKPYTELPLPSDAEGWRRYVDEHDKTLRNIGKQGTNMPGLVVETKIMGGVTVYVARPLKDTPESRRPMLSIHGGGWTNMGGPVERLMAQIAASRMGATVYGVDYRTPPDHPFPAPLDDCLSVYREMLKIYPASKILVEGGSAGGNLAAALMLKARDVGLPPPASLLLDTPVTDLTGAGDTLQTNQFVDVLLKRWDGRNVALYAGKEPLTNPYLSPLLGDLTRGFPPTYLRTGTRDLFLSDTVRLHAALRKAGVEADLFVREAMPHGGFGLSTPEDQDNLADTMRWLNKHWPV